MIRVILMCLLTCCSSFMPLKQSVSIVNEDYTHFVERKTRENYYAEKQYEVLYSFNMFADDVYWVNMRQSLLTENQVFLGGTIANLSNYSITHDGTHWLASSTTLSSMSLCYVDGSGNIGRFPQNEVSFTRAEFYMTYDSADEILMNLEFDIYDGSTRSISYIAYFDDSVGFIGCIMRLSDNFYLGDNNYTANCIVSLPKGACGISIPVDTTIDYDDGFHAGYSEGYATGYRDRQVFYDDVAWQDGYIQGRVDGYADGLTDGQDGTGQASVIVGGVMDVALIPVNVFFKMFDYEVFGINIAGFVSGLLTIAMIIIIFRFIFGGKV